MLFTNLAHRCRGRCQRPIRFEWEANSFPYRSSCFNQVPIDPNDPLVLEALQRFREDEITRAFLFFKSNDAEFAAGFTFLNRHHAIVFDLRLKMSILRRLLPKRIRLRFTSRFDNVGKAFRFRF